MVYLQQRLRAPARQEAWLSATRAWRSLREAEVALAVGVEKMTHAKTSLVTEALNCALDHEVDAASGPYPGLFALVWQAHANKYGTTRADVSAVVKKTEATG